MKNLTIKTKFVIGIISVALLLGVPGIIYITSNIKQNFTGELLKKGIFMAEHLSDMSTHHVLTDDFENLLLILYEFKNMDKDIKYIYIEDADGNILTHTFNKGFPAELKKSNMVAAGEESSIRSFSAEGEHFIDIAIPMMKGQIGTLHLAVSETPIERGVNQIVRLVLLVTITALVFGVFVVIFLGNKISNPIYELVEGAKAVASGNFNAKVPVRTNDEIGQLGSAFNMMTQRLSEAVVSKSHLDDILESIADIMVIVDSEGRIMQVNNTAVSVLGYSKEELIGSEFGMLFGKNRREEKQTDFFSMLLDTGIARGYETACETKGHDRIPSILSGSVLKDDNGDITDIIIIAKDITDRKHAEEALLKAKRDWEETFNQIKDMITIHDAEFNIILANKAAESGLGLTMTDILLNKCYKSYHGRDCPPEECPSCRTLKTGEPVTFEMFEPHLNRFIEIKAMPRFDSDNNVIGVIHVVRDITERRLAEEEKQKLEDQLRHAQKMEAIGTLTSGIAHDFNNILNVIMGYSHMVFDKMEADSPSKEQMSEVLTAAERAANLTKKLLAFSRKQIADFMPININETIINFQKMLVRIIGENIDLNLDLADKPVTVMADAWQIEQVLMNLASNAKDAMPEGGRLTIGTGIQEMEDKSIALNGYGKPGMYALITVTDTGHGIDEETQKRIFDPFFTTKGVDEGTGLDLAISYGIIKQHNGYIKVYSKPGQGTLFKIYLPLIEEPASLAITTETANAVRGGNETILVAEDDASLRDLARIVLESFGYNVITAEDGEDALSKFTENRDKIQLVILDMIMPKKGGKEVGEVIREKNPLTKILIISGYTMDIVNNRELFESSFDFIHKPFLPKDLLKKVREILDRG